MNKKQTEDKLLEWLFHLLLDIQKTGYEKGLTVEESAERLGVPIGEMVSIKDMGHNRMAIQHSKLSTKKEERFTIAPIGRLRVYETIAKMKTEDEQNG